MGNSRKTKDFYDIPFYKSLKGERAFTERVERGRQPIIDINGHPFFVNIAFGLLQPKDNFSSPGISINDMEADSETGQLFFYYHVPTMTLITFDNAIKEFPKDVVGVYVPNRYYLDPVGMALLYDREPSYYMDGIRLTMYQKAKIVPLQKTPLAALIVKNGGTLPVERNNSIIKKNRKGL